MGRLCSKAEQLDLLRLHEIELARLQSAVELMKEELTGVQEAEKARLVRHIEYTTAQITRQQISIALVSSRLRGD